MAISVDKQGLKKFVEKWTGRGKEDEDDRSYWIDLFQNVFAQSDVTDRLDFQKKVIGEDGNTKRIDVYIPETNIIIEQKSLGIALDKPQAGHKGMTPYEQAKYYDNGLTRSEKARWIVTSNFEEIWIYDMEKRKPEESVIKVYLNNLANEYHMLQFLFDPQVEQIRRELKVSQEAGDRIGKVYDALLSLYPGEPTEEEYRSLNLFCVRLVFCYYAEDAGLFGKYQFRDYVASFNPKHLRNGLKDLFRILDTNEGERDRTEEPELLAFPYVNGGLFADRNIIIPQIDEKTQSIMTETSDFNWSEISPTIFGAVFESTLNQETRRKGGMHYTSIENIHKVIDPLFLDNLKEEYKTISESKQPNVKRQKLHDYQNKLGSLKFLDPACGSGNFLTETYLSLRRIENEVIKNIIELDKTAQDNQIVLGELGSANSVIKVNLSQFYGIEINDFAVSVAKTALWIAESQMLKETEAIVYHNINYLPLKSYINIVEGNALRIDWKSVIPASECSFIMGNPPFIGHQMRDENQVEDMKLAFYDLDKHGKLDYVCAWYNKAADYMKSTSIKTAFVSTNSICQGESVELLWDFLKRKSVEILYAYRTFIWDSEANITAHVHCVVIGFSCSADTSSRKLYDSEGKVSEVEHINGYLVNADDVYVQSRGACLTPNMPEMHKGSQATDDLGLILEPEEYCDFIKKYPEASKLVRRYMGSYEFINNKDRYCLWLYKVDPSEYKGNAFIINRLQKVSDFRKTSKTESVRKQASIPALFTQIRQPSQDYLAFPAMSSSRREYMPIGYLSSDVIASNQLYVLPGATAYIFGVMTSIVHMYWMKTVCGRLKSDYRYAPAVYNNFPWPEIDNDLKTKIEQTASNILASRSLYPNSSLADLYDPLTMPAELRKAHEANDKAVMKAYGFKSDMTESEIVAELMKMYQKLTEEK